MQVEGKGSRVFRSDDRTRRNKEERRKGERHAGLANFVRS